ncbi:MAG: FISUMP domain-containing protein [Desulfobacterales bacterium]
MKNRCRWFLVLLLLFPVGCSSSGSSGTLSNSKSITEFGFAAPLAMGVIDGATRTISVTVPFGTDVSSLAPTIVHTGESINPESGLPQDFTAPVTYTVRAENSSTRIYTVTVAIAPSSAKSVTLFRFEGLSVDGEISEASHEIDVTVPAGTDVRALAPTIALTGASISPASGEEQDFTDLVDYTVTAADSSTQTYTVSVTVAEWAVCGDVLTYAGENYPTIQIGGQCWFAKNLNVGTMALGNEGQGASCVDIVKFCYDDMLSNCTGYGGIYTWNQAMCGAATEGAQGICPEGWHVPSDPEYVELSDFLGDGSTYPYPGGNYPTQTFTGSPAGDRLKLAGLCQGRVPCGDSGFDALLGGVSYYDGGIVYNALGTMGSFWTSSLVTWNGVEAWRRGVDINYSGVDGSYFWTSVSSGRSVRCVKDIP